MNCSISHLIQTSLQITSLLFLSLLNPVGVRAQTLTLMAGGDVLWTQDMAIPPFEQNLTRYQSLAVAHNPFQSIATILQSADLTFVNLESPIADQAPLTPLIWAPTFRADSSLAQTLKMAGIDLVSTANNHALDAGIQGLQETRHQLEQVNIVSVGTGETLGQARQPALIEKAGIRVALLAYTHPDNSLMGYATASQPGVAPLIVEHILEDIHAVDATVDHVVISLHWGETSQRSPSANMRAIAHQIINAGGDMILGHHPHVPQGMELYQGRPIIYSLGNLVFPYSRPSWGDNILVRATLTPDRIDALEILPIAGLGQDITQPYVLQGERANQLLEQIQAQSASLNTALEIRDDIGYLKIPIETPVPQPADLEKMS